jgi:hypothetical protein
MKTTHLRAKFLPLLVGAALAGAATSHAAVYFTLQQQGTDLLLSLQAGGSLDTSGLGTPNSGGNEPGGKITNTGTVASPTPFSLVTLAVGSASGSDLYTSFGITGPSDIGPGGGLPALTPTTSITTTGPFFGFAYGTGATPFKQISLPTGYVSGATLSAASATFANTNLAALGINVGNYTWTLGNNDTINLTVSSGGGGSSVPETGSLLVPALAMSALGLIQWRRRARRT